MLIQTRSKRRKEDKEKIFCTPEDDVICAIAGGGGTGTGVHHHCCFSVAFKINLGHFDCSGS